MELSCFRSTQLFLWLHLSLSLSQGLHSVHFRIVSYVSIFLFIFMFVQLIFVCPAIFYLLIGTLKCQIRKLFLCERASTSFSFFFSISLSVMLQISRASLTPESSYIAKPAASWLDDFLVWISPEAFGCCRKFLNASYCPPDDQVGGFITCLV